MTQVHWGTRWEAWREAPRNGTPYALYSGTATERPSLVVPKPRMNSSAAGRAAAGEAVCPFPLPGAPAA